MLFKASTHYKQNSNPMLTIFIICTLAKAASLVSGFRGGKLTSCYLLIKPK
jgi:hypothetical protein